VHRPVSPRTFIYQQGPAEHAARAFECSQPAAHLTKRGEKISAVADATMGDVAGQQGRERATAAVKTEGVA